MERTKNYIILVLLIALGIFTWIHFNRVDPEPIVITIPAKEGSTGVVDIDSVPTETVEVPVYLPGKVKEKKVFVVDSLYKDEYEKAVAEKDSLKQKLLFYEAITINEFDDTVIDNDTIKVDLYAKTRGKLLAYKVDYNIKESEFTYTPEVVNVRPPITLLLGVEGMIATEPQLKFDAYLQGQKGHAIGAGVDTQGNYYVGYKHTISFRKKNK